MYILNTKNAFDYLDRAFSKIKENRVSAKKKGKMPQQAEPHQWMPQEAAVHYYPDGQARRVVFCKCAVCELSNKPLCTE